MHTPPPLHTMDILGPLLGAGVFVVIISLVREPIRRNLNALLIAGSTVAYLSGGFGVAELLYPILVTPVAYFALRSYRWVGVGWLLHAGWDILHHLYGNPIWPFMPTSSFGCLLFDSAIAVWFLADAPSVFGATRRATASPIG